MRRTKRVSLTVFLVTLSWPGTSAGLVQTDATALLLAARDGRMEEVESLLAAGADANARRPGDQTALMLAAGGGHTAVVKLLLDRGADPTAWDADEDTALGAYAAANGHTEVVELLIEAGASVLAANRNGMNPLMFAALYGHLDCMLLLESEMLPLAAAQSLSDLADVLSRMGREVDAARVRTRATAIREAELGHRELANERSGTPALLMLARSDGRCIDLGYPRLARCVNVGGCRYTRTGKIRVTWLGVGTDPREIVERFVRDARREAEAVMDVRVEFTYSLGRNRLSMIEADGIEFSEARCKALVGDGQR